MYTFLKKLILLVKISILKYKQKFFKNTFLKKNLNLSKIKRNL